MRRHGEHGAGEVLRRVGFAADAAREGWLGLDAGQALPEAVGVLLRELGSWEGVLDLLQVAGRAGVLLPFAGLEVAVRALLLLARQARGRAVGPGRGPLPLRVREEVQRFGSPAGLAGGAGPGGLAEGVQVQLAAEPLEQLRDALGRAALARPGRRAGSARLGGCGRGWRPRCRRRRGSGGGC